MAEIVVDIKQGKLKGIVRDNIDGGKYFSFRGIPFAEPPVGSLRFKEPQELKPWSGIKDALEESKKSAQYEIMSKVGEGGDDCLYLNVATNSLTDKKPVMVWIHGGGFKKSSNTYQKYSPDYLLKKDIVFVGINYRLGVLGFLNMEHEECAGNQGLKDQMAALIWIQENIEVFGGNPENVTIFGESAGGASVHALCLSPRAKGLFHKAIAQSGVVSNPWAHTYSNKECGYSLAKAFGKKCYTPLETIEYLRTIPSLDLVTMYENLNNMEMIKLTLELVPTQDKSVNPVLPQPIQEMNHKGVDVPLLIGYNSHEGILRFLDNTEESIMEIDNDFESAINDYLKINDALKLSHIAKTVREYYFGKEKITEAKINELVQCFGDLIFVNNILEVVDIQMQKSSPTYLYKFSYRPDYPTIQDLFKSKIEGTCHADEMGCLFFSELRRGKLPKDSRDRTTMERMTTMWTNFAKTGDPTPTTNDLIPVKWRSLQPNKKNYLEINDDLTCGQNPDSEMWNIWRPLLESLQQ
ncbi:juvenile hormone esterase-like isoform X2 [Phymastichus coffea]|nr:juvenile hormone esterase-like isoform X2 [Phymastichus coffea]XP_058793060.1 juvenile hormone esterase-like isoform X2 [Phymastichus coffea]XP_058793061.1 juvenile hormone esterase-like isoform X2 [Phymastichus coffea]